MSLQVWKPTKGLIDTILWRLFASVDARLAKKGSLCRSILRLVAQVSALRDYLHPTNRGALRWNQNALSF